MKPSSLPSIVVSFSSTESESQCSQKTKLENLDRPPFGFLRWRPPFSAPENATEPPEDANKPLPKPKDGVIRPPGNVDPDMTVKPFDNNATMPVIPPPGSPGDDPSIKPK
jgi:hypothetical protein